MIRHDANTASGHMLHPIICAVVCHVRWGFLSPPPLIFIRSQLHWFMRSKKRGYLLECESLYCSPKTQRRPVTVNTYNTHVIRKYKIQYFFDNIVFSSSKYCKLEKPIRTKQVYFRFHLFPLKPISNTSRHTNRS